MSTSPHESQRRLERLEALIHEMEEGPDSPERARAREIVRAVLDLHGDALARMMALIAAEGHEPIVRDGFLRDPVITGALLLHGLHPVALDMRVRTAVEALTATLRAHGARVSAFEIVDSTVRIRLERDVSRGGLPAGPLRVRVEDAILAAAPDVAAIEITIPDDVAAFVPVEAVRLRDASASRGRP